MVRVVAKYDNIMPFIHLPVQSGNDDILKLMGRQYTIAEYQVLFEKLKSTKKDVSFSTDIIVGFPNETKEQFQDTLDLVKYAEFDNAFTFVYSPRSGTPAAKFDDNISLEVKKERLQELNNLVNSYMLKNNKKWEDKVVDVLVDGTSKKDINTLSGYTPQNKLVNFAGSKDLIGKIVKVKVIEAKSFSLNGVLCNE
jgi:tRNA-2-methylthio-N6-dimethylallyladenosine synthase